MLTSIRFDGDSVGDEFAYHIVRAFFRKQGVHFTEHENRQDGRLLERELRLQNVTSLMEPIR